MTLAARCPACATVFRVVQDQLRVSEGWVRCGRCAEVFNAIDGLVDIDAEAAAKPAQRPPGRDRVLEDLARVTQAGGIDIETPSPPPPSIAPPPPAPLPQPQDEEPSPAAFDDSEFRAEPPEPRTAGHAPEFVRRAERAARWQRPIVRLGLAVAAIAGATLLAAQAAVEYRDLVAARWPFSRAALEPACGWLGCRVEAPRSIESLAVESSGLVRIDSTSTYRLSVVLRNRASIALAAPAVDLTLTDSQGSVIARRVIRLAEFGQRENSVAGASDLPLQLTLAAVERPVSGYTIEIFYP